MPTRLSTAIISGDEDRVDRAANSKYLAATAITFMWWRCQLIIVSTKGPLQLSQASTAMMIPPDGRRQSLHESRKTEFGRPLASLHFSCRHHDRLTSKFQD
jgi:hypothetical protein